jgi:hypothetical protein
MKTMISFITKKPKNLGMHPKTQEPISKNIFSKVVGRMLSKINSGGKTKTP